jgi:eight-cysteine-cluster-containing protein
MLKRAALTMILVSVATPALAAFPDAANHRYRTAIEYVESQGIVEGYPDGTYRPNQTINRAEFTKIVVGAVHGQPPVSREDCFSDVSGAAWYAAAVCYARNEGIIGGYVDGTFRPGATINLAEAAKIVALTFDLTVPAVIGNAPWYEPYLGALRQVGALPLPEPDAGSLLTRGQMAEIIYRVKTGESPPSASDCVVGGCSGQLCIEEGDPGFSTCEWRSEYACYANAVCKRQTNGDCGWTQTAALETCLENPPDDSDPVDGGEYLPYQEGVIGGGTEIVLFFWASWCPNCQVNDQRITDWEDDGLLARNVYQINYDTATALRQQFGVNSQDTFILLDADGDELDRASFPSEQRLRGLVQ